MDPFNVLTAIATTVTAVIAYRKMFDEIPVLQATVFDIPESNRHDRPEREKLQQDGYYMLRLSVVSAPQNWRINAIKINGAMIPCEITDPAGQWVADRLPDKKEVALTHGKVKTKHWKIIKDTNSNWDFLIKPDNPDHGALELIVYGNLFLKARVPFSYRKTQFFEIPRRIRS